MISGRAPFPLSDATALLLRLQLESSNLDLAEDWRDLGEAYLDFSESINSLFYDFHAMVALLFGKEERAFYNLKHSIEEQVSFRIN